MTMPPLQHLRVWHTLKAMPHPPQLLWRLSGATLQCAHNKYLYTVADNAVPVNIVPCTFIQAPAFLACRIRLRLVPRRYPTKPLSLESFASSKFFCLSRRSSLSARVWSELENPPPTLQLPNYRRTCLLRTWVLLVYRRHWIQDSQSEFIDRRCTYIFYNCWEWFFFSKTIWSKKFSWIFFSTPTITPPYSWLLIV